MNPDDDRRAPRLDHENLDAYQRALDVYAIAQLADAQDILQGKRLLVRVVAMLSKMCR